MPIYDILALFNLEKFTMTDTLILQELITDAVPFRVHNVKIDKLICECDLPMMFLSHYDSLPDDIKTERPLGDFLQYSTQKMTAEQANSLLSLAPNTIKYATHIKITGTTVFVWDELPLALHLQFTNTSKDFDPLRLRCAGTHRHRSEQFCLCRQRQCPTQKYRQNTHQCRFIRQRTPHYPK